MIKIGIVGYGNLGKGVEMAIQKQADMEVFGIFTKRDPNSVKSPNATVYSYDEILNYKNSVDVLVLCGSSERDLREQSVTLAQNFNIVDSFDMHALIQDHVNSVASVAHEHNTTALVSVGWDPGIFSAQKTVFDAILPQGQTQSFWGEGISQGHSDVAGRVPGVKIARSYSIPNKANIEAFRNHETIDASNNHHKICYVVTEADADRELIEKTILNIPHYFKAMSSEVRFIDEETMINEHSMWKQAGRVIRSAETSPNTKHTVELSVNLDSNPEFTSSVLVAYARAVYKMHSRKEFGAFTALDVRASDLSSKSKEVLIKEML